MGMLRQKNSGPRRGICPIWTPQTRFRGVGGTGRGPLSQKENKEFGEESHVFWPDD
jgi:hypothetical protein